MPRFTSGFRSNPATEQYRHPQLSGTDSLPGYSVVSLFAGCGGLDLGFLGGFRFLGKTFQYLPFHIKTAIDNSPDAVDAYKLNLGNHVQEMDLATADLATLPRGDVLLGGFPCQDFSSCGKKQGVSGKRGRLYRVLVEYMTLHQPTIVVAENVPHLARLNEGKHLETILTDLESTGYRFTVWELYGPNYGLPQSRRRLFIVGVRNDIDCFPVCPKATHVARHVPIDEALRDLEKIEDESIANQSQYFVASRATSGGGQGDHSNQRGKVAYCIRANSRGRIQFHYALDRRLTVRECARLQSFPDEFVFPFSTQRNLTLIGNAVPPILGYQAAKSVVRFLDGSQTTDLEERKNYRQLSLFTNE